VEIYMLSRAARFLFPAKSMPAVLSPGFDEKTAKTGDFRR
jgi:hypothetical protein